MNKKTASQQNSLLEPITVQELGFTTELPDTEMSYSIWIKALMQNWRQGTVSCKTRGEVSFSNRKPWKQKGTGRARAGSARSPLWRGGGILFGPQPRVRNLKVNQKNKSQVLAACMSNYAQSGSLFAFDVMMASENPSTSFMHNAFTQAGLSKKKVVMFMGREDYVHWTSVNNLAYVHVVNFDDVNAYELSLGNCVVVLKKDMDMFKNMVAKWN